MISFPTVERSLLAGVIRGGAAKVKRSDEPPVGG
jgi:hypothetical protein